MIRVGRHVEDFEADRAASTRRSLLLPIPDVLHVGSFADEYCCISTFAPGTPLESCSQAEWSAVIPSLVDSMEAMRQCRPDRSVPSWSTTLLAADGEQRVGRLVGWRDRIKRSPDAADALGYAMRQLRNVHLDIDLDRAALTLTHGDLINRNVHVAEGSISGIFDWGCMRWGDHLYDLAWFEFWSPWYPDLDIGLLRAELDRRWREAGHEIASRAERERACLLHIGADHLIYNAVIDSASGLVEIRARMSDLHLI